MKTPRRVIPSLLLSESGLVKTRKFGSPKYLGDAINAVRIFNECEADELILWDIHACRNKIPVRYSLIEEIVSEAFMPVCYGGGVSTVDEIRALLRMGVEKVSICSAAVNSLNFISQASRMFGTQSIVGVVEVKRKLLGGYDSYCNSGRLKCGISPILMAQRLVEAGVGEVVIQNIDRDGEMIGYDLALMSQICNAVQVPVIASGGAGKLDHIAELFQKTEVCGAAAGSLFVFHGPEKGVLINYPSYEQIQALIP